MAEKQIYELTALGAAPAAGDVLAIEDVDAGNVTRKITVSNLLASCLLADGSRPLTIDGLTTKDAGYLQLQNTTPATAGVKEQYPPAILLSGHGWTGSADQQVDHLIVSYPTGWGNPTFQIYVRENLGSWNQILGIDSTGQFATPFKFARLDARETYIYGLYLANDTLATASYDQFSPTVRCYSKGWDTGAAASKYTSWDIGNFPESGNPLTGVLGFRAGHDTQIPNTDIMKLTWDGANARMLMKGSIHADQLLPTGALPVLSLDQADVSEEFIKFTGAAAAATLTQSFVAEADVTTATRAGFLKIVIDDVGNQITDGAYYIPFYSLS